MPSVNDKPYSTGAEVKSSPFSHDDEDNHVVEPGKSGVLTQKPGISEAAGGPEEEI
jgi:hypothetical protein